LLECEINSEPKVALKILDSARTQLPATSKDINFIRLLLRVLRCLGDIEQLRWVFLTALGDTGIPSSAPHTVGTAFSEALKNDKDYMSNAAEIISDFSLPEKFELVQEYLETEIHFGQTDTMSLELVRARRNSILSLLEEKGLKPQEQLDILSNRAIAKHFQEAVDNALYKSTADLFERYCLHLMPFPHLSTADGMLKERCRGSTFINEVMKKEEEIYSVGQFDGASRRRGRDRGGGAADSTDPHGLPAVIRDFISRLPAYQGPVLNIPEFIERLRRTVLPPRPEGAEISSSSGTGGGVGITQANGCKDVEDDGDDDAETHRDDIFRRRQRAKLIGY